MTENLGSRPISVAISHCERYVAIGIRAWLRDQEGIIVREPGVSGSLADVLIADYQGALKHVGSARRDSRATPVLVVTDQQTAWQVRCALDAGVRGYLLHDCSADDLSEAVHCIAAGRSYVARLVSERLIDSYAYAPPTSRELEVLRLLARGLGNRDIGHALGIGEGTVKTHVRALFEKLGKSTRTEVMVEARRRGFLPKALTLTVSPEDSTA